MDKKKRQRPWFDVAKALQESLGISLGMAAYIVAWMKFGWLMLTNRQFPPQWLFVVGAWLGWVIGWVQMIAVWCSVQWLRARVRLMRWQGKRKGFEVDREEFMFRCVFWSQIASAVMLTDQFPPGGCDRMGSLSGRLVRYSRTFDPANTYDLELAEDAMYQVEREFTKLPRRNQETAFVSLKDGARIAEGKIAMSFLGVIEREEKRIKSKREQAH